MPSRFEFQKKYGDIIQDLTPHYQFLNEDRILPPFTDEESDQGYHFFASMDEAQFVLLQVLSTDPHRYFSSQEIAEILCIEFKIFAPGLRVGSSYEWFEKFKGCYSRIYRRFGRKKYSFYKITDYGIQELINFIEGWPEQPCPSADSTNSHRSVISYHFSMLVH